METLKNLVAVLAGIIGLVTGLLTLYAKYLDVKKGAAGDLPAAPDPAPTMSEPVSHEIAPGLDWIEVHSPTPEFVPPPAKPTREVIERSRAAVRPPAVALLVAGVISLFSNLFIAGFGYVDRFVMPLTEEAEHKWAMKEAARIGGPPPAIGTSDGLSDDATVVLTICVLLSMSVGSVAAVWGAFGMLRLRGYWLSVAGSIAIMGGGFTCCMIGVPIGIWSLATLYRPEVAASFRGS